MNCVHVPFLIFMVSVGRSELIFSGRMSRSLNVSPSLYLDCDSSPRYTLSLYTKYISGGRTSSAGIGIETLLIMGSHGPSFKLLLCLASLTSCADESIAKSIVKPETKKPIKQSIDGKIILFLQY